MEDCSKNACSTTKHECCPPKKESCSSDDGDMSKFLLEVADRAWSEVLKEEIKKHIVSTQGERMKELAKIVSEANGERWKHKMEKKHGCADFKEKLCRFFGQKK